MSSEAEAMKKESEHTLTPKLRFPEFQDGEGWQEVVVQETATVIAGQSPRGEYYNDTGNGTPFYQGKTDFGDVFINPPTKWTTQVTRLALEDDILMSVRAPVGALNVSTQEICIGRGLAALRAKEDKWFLYYLLLQVNRLFVGNGGSVFDSINKSQIESTQIPFPLKLAEQKKIADCLGSLDDLIAAEGRKLAVLSDHKRGLMQQLFPQPGQTQPRLRFPEFRDKGEWKNIPLGRLLSGSPDYGVNAAAVPFSENLPKYLRITDISDDGRYLPDKKVSVDLDATDGNYLNEGDIVLARTGASVGKSYRYRKEDGRLVFAGFLIRIKPDPRNLISTYLANFLTTEQFWKWVVVTSARSGQPGINSAEYSSLAIPLPPDLSEQQRIADCLSALDAMITAQAAKIDALKQHKRGLMQQLFPAPEEQ